MAQLLQAKFAQKAQSPLFNRNDLRCAAILKEFGGIQYCAISTDGYYILYALLQFDIIRME